MPRYALKIEYDGSPFHGWQRQANGLATVQGRIEEALSGLDGGERTIFGAGRTDTGVHALGQVAHADLERDWDPFRLSEALNHHLKPDPVAIVGIALVDNEFHARFSATERSYTYRIVIRRAPLVFGQAQVWRISHALDVDAMRAGAAHLIGRHDFTTFRAAICQADSPVKTLDVADVEGDASRVAFHFRARSFLHNQVRSMVGTLERVGAGKWAPDDVGHALAAADRASCGPVAPPDGLYLTGVTYPTDPFK